MILIADSGSTKTQWCLLSASGQMSEFRMDGINPFYQTPDAIKNSVSNQLLPQMGQLLWAGKITNIYFYGAGCTPEKSPLVKMALKSINSLTKETVSPPPTNTLILDLSKKSNISLVPF